MPPLLVAWVIDTVQGTPPIWISDLLPNATPIETAIFLAILATVIFLLESVTQWLYQSYFLTTAQQVQHDIRCHVYDHLQNQDMAYFEDHRLGQLIAIVNDGCQSIGTFFK